MTDRRQQASDLAPGTLAAAAVASAGATLVIGRFGLAGTLAGAALLPVLVALIREVARRPARRIERVREARRRPRAGPEPAATVRTYRVERSWSRTLAGLRWRRVLATGGVAFLLVVGAFTVAELALGDSVASDRRTTFFSAGDGAEREEEPRQEEREPVTIPPAQTEVPLEETTTEPTETAPTTTEPPATTTEPPATTTAP